MKTTLSMRDHWTLDPSVTFLNHGSFGSCPRPILALQSELREAMERRPIEFLARELHERLHGARVELAKFLSAPDDALAFVPNATTGVNSVLRSLTFEPGDQVVITNHGYNACNNAAQFVTQRAGAQVVVADLPLPLHSPAEALEAILQQVNDKTRLVLVDHVTSPTGIVLPVAELTAALNERGVDILIDGAHAPGMLPLDLTQLGAAYYTGNCHKWMCAPKGAGFLYVRADRRDRIRPVVISHGANAPLTDESRFEAEFGWVGTSDPTPYLCVPETLRFMSQLFPGGWDELRRRNRELLVQARRTLLAVLPGEAIAPEEMLGSLASVTLPDADRVGPVTAWDVDPLQAALDAQHGIEVPVMPFPKLPRRMLRISAAAYNELEDYERLATALKAELELE